MLKAPLIAAVAAFALCAPVAAQEKMDKSKEWCTDAHMKQMDDDIAKMTDAKKQKEAKDHLTMSKDAMKAKDMDGCVTHMDAAHKAMGM
jgi:hypothetical protein